jgi:hypothetical protein
MIDKNRPLKLVTDKDQRLVKDGEMVAATNVTISHRGAGTESILKTVRGFKGVLFDILNGETSAVDADVTVIGKVEDPQLGYIYLFVATSAEGVHTHDMIVRVDANNYDPVDAASNPVYLTVFRNDWLNFDQDGFVSADVINKAFQQDGVIQSILYFTDNNNPPRKINVDRALAGEYDDYSDAQLDFALNAIKAAPINPPTFSFETNTSVPINNFERATFQFAVQYIYKDGELSAIGPYSKLAFPDHIAASGLEGDESGQLYFTDNECIIDTKWRSESSSSITPDLYIRDVSKIRLLGTRDNGSTMFVIDEFDANANLTREVFASSVTVYEASSGLYRFYNDGVYQAVSDNQVNKLYDNVPLKAEGQSIAGDRLMYSNYEEGRPNSETVVNLTAKYADEVSGGSVLIADDDTDLIFESATPRTNSSDNMFWEWDFLDVASFTSAGDTVPGGTLFRTSIVLKPKASVAKGSFVGGYDSSNYLLVGNATDQQGYTYNLGVGHFSDADTHIDITAPGNSGTNIEAPSFSASLSSPEDVTLSAFTDLFFEQVDEFFNGYEIEYTITLGGSEFDAEIFYAPPGASGTTGSKLPVGGKMKVKWGFKVTHPDATTVKVYPYVKEISQPTFGSLVISGSLGGVAGPTTGDFAFDSVNWGLSSGFTDQYLSSNITGGINVIGPSSKSMRTFAAKTTFKAGCSHDLGIVYYDKYNRSGFVNKLGSFYAKHPGERSDNRGVCSVEIDWNSNYDAPSWAERYQIVYGGMSTYESFIQYSVGRAFVPRTSAFSVNSSKKQIYVKLDTLNNYKNDKSAVAVDYSFTEGDKLRVVKYSVNGDTDPASDLTWPLANDSSTMIEFNVVGVVTLGDSNNPIAPSATPSIQHKGDFIILEAPQVAAGIGSQTSGVELKYPGWDWFSVAYDADNTVRYPDGTAPAQDPLWGHTSIVEILTPRRSERRLWHEIGEAGRVGVYKGDYDTSHGPNIIVSDGDCYLRTSSVSTPEYSGGAFQVNDNPNLYVYKNMEIESQYVSDFFQSKRWSRGRSHTTFERAATINRYNSITYSEAYSDDTSILALSSFNTSAANFFDLPSENGRCSFIGKLGDNLLSIQENKCSLIAINKDVIQTGTQSGLVSLSSRVLNNLTQYSGFYGTENPESVLVRDSICYFADLSQSAIVKIGQKMEVISETDIKSSMDGDFASLRGKPGAKKVYTGYDPEDSVLYVTMRTPTETIRTIGYNEALGVWQSNYTFYPKTYASLKNTFFMCQYDTSDVLNYFVHYQSSLVESNKFPGSQDRAKSSFAIICNDSPSIVKAYKSISIEGDSAWDTAIQSSSGQIITSVRMPSSNFSEKEDAFYINIPRDESLLSTSEYIPLGTTESAFGARIKMLSSLKGKHIPIGYQLYKGSPTLGFVKITRTFGGSVLDSKLVSIDRASNELVFDERPDLAGIDTNGGDTIFLAAEKILTGDQIRGHYIRVECSKTPTGGAFTLDEVYSVNATYEESKANHGGTQQ